MKKFLQNVKNNPWMLAFMLLMLVLLFVMPIMSLDVGNSGDEDGFQWPYAEKVYNFYATGGQDTACLEDDDMGMHGGFFDPLTYAVVKWFHVEDYSSLRHCMNSIFGWIGILFAGLIAWQVGGWRAAVFTAILLFLSPRYLGHSFNNPKDLIFAAMMTAGSFYVLRLIKQYPKPKIVTAVLLAVFGALAVVSRFAGYILFFFLVLFLIVRHLMEHGKKCASKNNLKTVGRYVIFVVAIVLVTFGLSIAMWPYIMSSPVQTMKEIVTGMSQYNIAIRQLFEGSLQWSDILPWYYTPKYILMTTPIAVLIGLVCFIICCWRNREDRFWAAFLTTMIVFPIAWIILSKANVYGGWRHVLFVYPIIPVAAGWGLDRVVAWIARKRGLVSEDGQQTVKKLPSALLNVGAVVVLLLLLAGPIRHILVNHPYEYIYFNELIGGSKKAFGQYEMDYYYTSTREASEWIKQHAEPKADGSKIIVGTWHVNSVQYYFRNDTARFQPVFIRWYEKENTDWDYAIFPITGINPEYLNGKAFPPKNTVKTIDVDGTPIALIMKCEDKNDYLGVQLLKQQKMDSAAVYLKKALEYDPNNLNAYLYLGEIYLRSNKIDSSQMFLKHGSEIDPAAGTIQLMYAYSQAADGKTDEAIKTIRKLLSVNCRYIQAYQLAIRIYLQKNDLVSAKKEFQRSLDNDCVDQELINLWIKYQEAQGISVEQAERNFYALMLKSFEKRGKKAEAKKLRELKGFQ